jgi:hypothetical protein
MRDAKSNKKIGKFTKDYKLFKLECEPVSEGELEWHCEGNLTLPDDMFDHRALQVAVNKSDINWIYAYPEWCWGDDLSDKAYYVDRISNIQEELVKVITNLFDDWMCNNHLSRLKDIEDVINGLDQRILFMDYEMFYFTDREVYEVGLVSEALSLLAEAELHLELLEQGVTYSIWNK